MSNITISDIGIKAHERYAQDQKNLDTRYIHESPFIPAQSEVIGTSIIYSSKWEALFELNLINIPWAMFLPPPKYHGKRKRLFSYRVLSKNPSFDPEEDQESFEEKKQLLWKSENETDKLPLLRLLDVIHFLNNMLKDIHCRMGQYQKG